MKIHLEFHGIVLEYEKAPMPARRFRALCALALAGIAGGVFLGALHIVGTNAIVAAVVAFAGDGFFKLTKEGF